jgi:hypothetical protein
LKHFNALPHSARKVEEVNKYLIPTQLTEKLLVHFRLKLIIAPNSFVSFSTGSHLLSMGLNKTQYGMSTRPNKT